MRVMKRFKAIFLALLVVLSCSLCACKSPEEEVIKLPDVHVGDEFEIEIRTSYGTAYRWDFEIKKDNIEFVKKRSVPFNPDPDAFGGGGHNIYTFRALEEGKCKIKFIRVHVADSTDIIDEALYEINILKG